MMLLSLIVVIKPEIPLTIRINTGKMIQSFFYSLLQDISTSLFQEIHSQNPHKPFTVSPLQGNFKIKQGQLELYQDEHYWFRITILRKDLSNIILENKNQIEQNLSKLGRFNLIAIYSKSSEHRWANITDYEFLLSKWLTESSKVNSTINMRFYSPTYFKEGSKTIPLPLPNLCLMSILKKWNEYSYFKFDGKILSIISKRLFISKYKLRTHILDFNGYSRIGFIGDCLFSIVNFRNDIYDKIINLLLDFAFFSGVGASTTSGMGQVKVISDK